MADYDSPWKEALDAYFQPFMQFCFPDLASNIDWASPPKMLDKELMQIAPRGALGARTVDKLVEVKLLSNAVTWLLIHLEVQSQRDASFAERMFVYFYRIRDKYNKKIVSLAVLGDGDINWRPDGFGESNFGCQFSFQFPIVKLIDHAGKIEELEKATNPFAFVIAAHLTTLQTVNAPEDRCQWKLRLLRPLYERGMSPEDVRKLFRVLDWMMQLPRDLQIQFRYQLEKFEQEKKMPYITSIERMGIEKGRKQGRKQGREEGREEGRLAGQIQLLQRILSIPVEPNDMLLNYSVAQLSEKLEGLQKEFDSRQSS